jgi:hypothetical protein
MPICRSFRSLFPAFALFGLFGAWSASAPAGAAVFYVGTGTGCTHQFISQAITAAAANGTGLDIIRLATPSLAIGNLLLEVNNHSVQLVGGFPDCITAAPTGRTTITFLSPDGDDGFWVHGATAERFFGLVNIDMVMGDNAGRGLTLQDLTTVALDNTTISEGQANDGGNIKLEGDVYLQLLNRSEVHHGQAPFGSGGGIHCQNGGTVYIDRLSKVHRNSSLDNGAGIFAFNCSITSEGWILLNNAGAHGGGIYAAGGSNVELNGRTGYLSLIDRNIAFNNGGGLFLVDAGTTATARNAGIIGNNATANGGGGGGGVWVGVGGTLFTMDVDASTCSGGRLCSVLAGNSSSLGNSGAILVAGGSTARVRQTRITGNYTEEGAPGSVATVIGTLHVEGCEIFGNSLAPTYPEVSRFFVTGTATIAFSTIVETTTSAEVFWTWAGSNFNFVSSIVQADQTFHASPVAAILDCVIAKEFTSFPAIGPRLFQVTDSTALFVNAASDDYRLKRGSPAQDFCDATVFAPSDEDIDNQLRNYDDPTDTNFLGLLDLGADEWRPDLFIDGFETGNTGRWSSSAP